MAQSLTKSSASLVAAGGDLAEAAALTATANAIVQDADSVGTALKTTSLRLRGTDVKVLEEEGLDSEGAVTSKSKLQSKVKAISGVDILTETGEYKSTYEILSQIADVWKDISDIDQAALLELISGKRNSSVVAAILQNPEELKRAFEDANNAAGSALRENERYLDSIQGKMDQFKNAVQAMWQDELGSKLVKDVVELGTGLIKVVDKLGLIKTLFVAIGTYLMTKHDLTGAIGGFFDAKTLARATERLDLDKQLKNAKQELEDIWAQGGSGDSDLGEEFDIASKRVDELTEKIKTNGMSIEDAKHHMEQFGDTTDSVGSKGIKSWNKLKAGVKAFGKQLVNALKSMAIMYFVTTLLSSVGDIIGGIKDFIDDLHENAEEAQEKLEQTKSELSSVKSELDSLNSALEDTQDRIDELMKQGSLSFVEKEELQRLKAENAELERKIALNKTLEESLQKSANSDAVNATDKYLDTSFASDLSKTERQDKASEKGGNIGKYVGMVGGAIVGALITYFTGGAGAAAFGQAIAIGGGIGSMLGEPIGGAIGSAVEGAAYDAEKTVEEEMKNMAERRKTLKQNQEDALAEGDSEAYKNATEALQMYDKQMAQHITQIQANYNAMDWATAAEEEKQKMIAYADWLDKYNIDMGATNAKSNAIARIFGDEASDELKEIKKRMQDVAEAGEKVSLADAFNGDEDAYNAFKTRLYNLGLTVYETEQYFVDQKKAADEAIDAIETYDAIKNIQKLTSGVNELKNAFKELHEEGIVSAETLLTLEDVFGKTDGWKEFFDTMSSGTATMEESITVAKNLAENYVDDILSKGELSDEERLTTISHLQSIGVTNAREFIDARIKKDKISDVVSKNVGLTDKEREEFERLQAMEAAGTLGDRDDYMKYQRLKRKKDFLNPEANVDGIIQEIEEAYGITLDSEEDRLLIEKAITAEKLKQEAATISAAKTAYDAAVYEKGVAEEKNKGIDSKITNVRDNNYSFADYGVQIKDNGRGDRMWYEYNGNKYYSMQELNDAIIADLNAQKVTVPSLPAEVTEIEVQNANNAADTAASELQAELDKRGLTLEIDLIGFDERVDKIQDVYSSLKSITTDYNKQGYLSIDNLQALLNLTPEYLSVLQMENGQLTINQSKLQEMLETKLDEAEATAVQTAITQLSALAERKQAIEISNSAVAANQASIELGTYSGALSTVAQDAIVAAGSVAAFNAALKGAQDNTFVSDEEVQQIMDNFNNTVGLIDSVRSNLGSSFNDILDPGSQTSPEEVADERFQKAMEYWENRIAANQAKSEQVQNEIDLLESKGQKADTSFYEEIIKLENERKWLLEQQKAEAQMLLSEFEEGSEEWWEIASTLNDIEGELDDVTASIVDLQDAIGEIDTYKFEEFNNRLDDITSKLETIRNLIAPDGEEDWFDDEGNWTETGVAVLGTQIQALETYKQGYQNTMDELAKYEPDYEGNESYYETLGIHSEQEYYDRVEELTDQQYQFAESISDTEQDIVGMYESSIDAVEEYTESLIDGYNDYIDSVKEALDAERDLYDFKKNVQKQAKDIAEIERRIMSLSGSTNAADIAERRRLEADLYGAREELDDTYYDHAKESQQNALDAEAEAYEEHMTKFVEGLRTSLEEATLYMDEFLMGVTAMVMYNADTVLTKYQETNLPLTAELTNPWEQAKNATNNYSGNALALMNEWTKQGGFFAQFNTSGTTSLTSPWGAGTTAATNFRTDVAGVMSGVVSNIASNVRSASGELSSLYNQIQDTERRAASANVSVNSSGNNNSSGYVAPQKKYYVTAFLDMGSRSLSVTKSDSNASTAMSAAKIAIAGEYEKYKGNSASAESAWLKTWRDRVQYTTQYYSKGTAGTPRDEWAITDEPQFGDELVLVPGKDGNLSFMRKGTGVVPADLTANLMEWGQFTPDSMNLGGGVNINMINNAVNKPEFNLSFEALVKAERIDENTLPEVKKFVQQEINSLVKQMNYAIKGKGGR